jgi:anaerobic ribonucleoside-triphosphate reductase
MVTQVIKRDGQVVFCDGRKIADAIGKAAKAANESIDHEMLARNVLSRLSGESEDCVDVETIQDLKDPHRRHQPAVP